MKKVITYGTFDMLHQGHINLLKRAKELGDYLIVGVTTENYDKNRGKLNVHDSLMQRIENVKNTGFADEIIIEEYEGQKIDDIQKYGVDIFTIGSDWVGKFDYLNEFCKVVYLERTKGISSTMLRAEINKIIKLGVIGTGRIANRFIIESKYVSGVDVEGVYNPNEEFAKEFANKHELKFFSNNIEEFFNKVDAVYIASPHLTHYSYIKEALSRGKHVLSEKPMALNKNQVEEVYSLAKGNNLVLLEAIKTAYCPGFSHMISLAKMGTIGEIKDIEASFTKIVEGDTRELKSQEAGGSMNELATYPLLPIIKLLGGNFEDIKFYSYMQNDVDLFTKGVIAYPTATASFKVGLGVKTEGELIISGTKGYIYVPSPWWKTECFEIRYEDLNKTQKYFDKFEKDGLRYEINEFANMINSKKTETYKLTNIDSINISTIIETYHKGKHTYYIK